MDRALFAYERLMLAGGRPYTVMLAARLHAAIQAEPLHEALDWLQHRHPALRCAVVTRAGREHFVTPKPLPPIPIRTVERTTNDAWFAECCAEIDHPLPRDDGPLARLVWIRAEAASELILIADHVICDGRSIVILLRDLVGRLVGPDHDRPPPPALTTIDQLFGPAPARLRWAERTLAAVADPAIWAYLHRPGRPRGPRPGPGPGPGYALRWELDRAATERLAAIARRERVSAYAALATAFLRAFRAVRPAGSLNRLVGLVDIRPFLAVRSTELLFALPMNVILSLSDDGDFWTQARRLATDLLAGTVALRPDRLARLAERLHARVGGIVDAALHGPVTNDLAFSHLGDVELSPGPNGSVETLAQLGSSPWSNATTIMSVASAGRLRFCLVSRPTVLPRTDAQRVADHAMALVASAVPR